MPLLRDVSRVALRNVRIIDGTGAPARQNQTLIIDHGRIRALGGVTEVVIPEGTQTLDLGGRTVLPGFVMLHEHMFYASANDNTHPQPFTSPRLFLAFGLTTIRTAGTDHPYVELNLKRSVDAGQVPGPEMHLTSPFMNGDMSGFLGEKVVHDRRTRGGPSVIGPPKVLPHLRHTNSSRRMLWRRSSTRLIASAFPSPRICDRSRVVRPSSSGSITLSTDSGRALALPKDDLGTDPDGPRAQDFIRLLIARKVVLTFTPVTEICFFGAQLELLHPVRRERYEREQRTAKRPHPRIRMTHNWQDG